MKGYFFIIASALFHASWNVLLKKSDNKYFYNFFMHLANFSVFTVAYLIFFRDFLYFDGYAVIVAFIASTFFTLYHLCVSTAYKYDDMSKLYPITTTSPLFVLIWAVIFLHEKVEPASIFGIFFIIFGVILLGNAFKNFSFSFNKAVMYAFLSAFMYSFGAIMDKLGVKKGNFILYVYMLTFFMTSYMFVFNRKYVSGSQWEYFKKNFGKIFLGGTVLFFSFLTYRYGLTQVNVSYATALRQVNALFGVILGYLIFKERITSYKVMGTIFIVIGAAILRLYM